MADLKARGASIPSPGSWHSVIHIWLKRSRVELKELDGSLHRDNKGLAWVNPYRQEVWDYLVEVGRQAAKAGFDEIQFDYYPLATDSTMKQVVFDEADTRGRSRRISSRSLLRMPGISCRRKASSYRQTRFRHHHWK